MYTNISRQLPWTLESLQHESKGLGVSCSSWRRTELGQRLVCPSSHTDSDALSSRAVLSSRCSYISWKCCAGHHHRPVHLTRQACLPQTFGALTSSYLRRHFHLPRDSSASASRMKMGEIRWEFVPMKCQCRPSAMRVEYVGLNVRVYLLC
jgi:hypothetical protein